MIVVRYFHYARSGRREELVELIRAEIQGHPGPHAVRLYSCEFGCSAPVTSEIEYESLEESNRYRADFVADPGTATYREKYNEMVSRHWTSELWNLVE